MLARIRSAFSAALGRARFEREMEEELRVHMAAYAGDLAARGVPREEAELRARREFGSFEKTRDECRDARGLRWPDEFGRNLRYTVRMLRKSPTFTLTAVATLALCIGANTAIFSVVDAVLLRPLPYPAPEGLAMVITIWRDSVQQAVQDGRTCEAVRKHAKSVDAAVFSDAVMGVNLSAGGGPRYVSQQRVSAGFFRVLGVAPVIGREFTVAEDREGGPRAAVLSHELWRRAFHADTAIAGRQITLRGDPYTVVGVMPQGFRAAAGAELWTPLRPSTTGEGEGANYTLVVRVRPGTAWKQAEAEVAGIGADVFREQPAGRTARLALTPLQEGLTEGIRRPLLIVWAAVGLVLLIGCVNLAILLLARSGTRTREIATRMALGSGRAAVVRQLLTESLVLAAAGGVAGVLVGFAALEGLKALALGPLGLAHLPVPLDGRVLAAAASITLLTGLLFGTWPAIHTTRLDLRGALALGGARGGPAGHRSRARRTLIAAEAALSVVLLVCAGLLIGTFAYLSGRAPGYESANAITAKISLQDGRYRDAAKVHRLFEESLERIRRMPGVEAAGVGLALPYERSLNSGLRLPDGETITTNVIYATPGYFEALRMRLLRGRLFAAQDRAGGHPVGIVNEAFATRYLRGREAMGARLGSGKEPLEVVGVVGDVQQAAGWGNFGPAGAVPAIYIPAAQTTAGLLELVHAWFSPSWVVRATAPPRDVIAGLQAAVAATDPDLAFAGFRTMEEVRSQAFAMQKLNAVLVGALGALALLLTAVGVYGLAAHTVVERNRELGIRMALGATRARAVATVASLGVIWAALGLIPGCAAAAGAARLLRTLLWGVRPGDPSAFAGASVVLLAVAAAASVLPALRAARIDPARTLREE